MKTYKMHPDIKWASEQFAKPEEDEQKRAAEEYAFQCGARWAYSHPVYNIKAWKITTLALSVGVLVLLALLIAL